MTLALHLATGDRLAEVRQHCEAFHYLHRWPDPRSLPFAYVLEYAGSIHASDGRLNGLVVFKKPQHHRQRGLFGYTGRMADGRPIPTSWQVLDLARVWIHPSLQTKRDGHALCIFSQMIGALLRQRGHERLAPVQRDWLEHHPPVFPDKPYHIELVISYCDLGHHDGVAYRASGFTWNGYTADRQKEVYFKLLKAPRADWRTLTTKSAQVPLFTEMDLPLVYS